MILCQIHELEFVTRNGFAWDDKTHANAVVWRPMCAQVHISQKRGMVFAKFFSPFRLKMERRVKAWLAVGVPSRCKDRIIKL